MHVYIWGCFKIRRTGKEQDRHLISRYTYIIYNIYIFSYKQVTVPHPSSWHDDVSHFWTQPQVAAPIRWREDMIHAAFLCSSRTQGQWCAGSIGVCIQETFMGISKDIAQAAQARGHVVNPEAP